MEPNTGLEPQGCFAEQIDCRITHRHFQRPRGNPPFLLRGIVIREYPLIQASGHLPTLPGRKWNTSKTHEPAGCDLTHRSLVKLSNGHTRTSTDVTYGHVGHIPVPAALGFLSGTADFSQYGDSPNTYTVSGFASAGNSGTELLNQIGHAYAGGTDFRDPLLSPIYSDLRRFPPTLLMSSTRDILLSATSNFERALHKAGVKTQLVVFDGLYHTFWLNPGTPEADEALARQACFLAAHVGVREAADPACKLEVARTENH